MHKSWLMCVLLGALAWGQAAPETPPAAGPDTSASVPADAPVITVKGICPAEPKAPAAKTATGTSKSATTATKADPAECKTVITKAEFEKLAGGISQSMTPQLKRQLGTVLPRLLAMSAEAKKKGLEKSPHYEETLKFAKMQILTNELQRSIQEEAAKVPPQEIADYYKKNLEAYQQYNLDRLFLARLKQAEAEAKEENDKDEKLTEEQQKAKEEQEKAKTDEITNLWAYLAQYDADGKIKSVDGLHAVKLPCSGMVQPLMIEAALKQGAAGVIVCGCQIGDCYYREGNKMIRERLLGNRVPTLKKATDRRRILALWLSRTQKDRFIADAKEFVAFVQALPAADHLEASSWRP